MRVSEDYKDTLREFYKLRSKKPRLTGYTERGDLQLYTAASKAEEPTPADVIRLNEYRPITNEERESQDARRYELIREAEAAYEAARGRFRDVMVRWQAQKEGGADAVDEAITEEDVVNQSKEVGALELALQSVRFALRTAFEYPSIPMNELLFDNPYDERMVEGVKGFAGSPFDIESTYVRLARAGEEVMYAKKSKPKRAVAAEAVIVAGGPGTPYEYLNPWSPSNVSFKGVMYPNAFTAIMAGVAEKLGDSVAVERIRAATSPEEAVYTRDEKGVPEEEWNRAFGSILMRVSRHKFRENPLLAEKLLQTGRARLVVVPLGDPLNTILGTGLQPDNPDIKNPKKWVGENLYGAALEYVRSEWVEERKKAAAAGMAAAAGGAGAGAGLVAATTSAVGAATTAAATAAGAVTGAVTDAVTAAASAAAAAIGVEAPAGGTPATVRVKRRKLKTADVPGAGAGATAEEGAEGAEGAAAGDVVRIGDGAPFSF